MAKKKRYRTKRRLDWDGGFIEPGEELPANYPPEGVESLLRRGWLEVIKPVRKPKPAAEE